ncbi:MAG: glycosyltransferase family 4 protein [Lachnospiraceae bacterium]|nr:glycosyltransferase family 4 protein [Lachnospiraceae bacterium]
MRIVIFGVGQYYKNRKRQLEELGNEVQIVCFIDNNSIVNQMDGYPILKPYELNGVNYDCILLMSKSNREMTKQLIEMGIPKDRIVNWFQFLIPFRKGIFKFYSGRKNTIGKKRILVLSTYLDYNGGTMAAVYAVRALCDKGYYACLAAEDGDKNLIKEITDEGMDVVLCRGIKGFSEEEQRWVSQFDAVVVNVFQMVKCAVDISKQKPVVWWIHESNNTFSTVFEKEFDYCGKEGFIDENFHNISVCAVSDIPKRYFLSYFPNQKVFNLPYGIPDKCQCKEIVTEKRKIIFAVIGVVCELKRQDLFVDAINRLPKNLSNVEFWMVGSIENDEFCDRIKEKTTGISNIKMLGNMSRKQMADVYSDISVVVCTSNEDSLPIACTEGMMYGKPIITTENTGTANYIKNEVNGFVCKVDSAEDLASRMEWMINHSSKLAEMGANARKVYEKYFSLESFGENLEKVLIDNNCINK